MSEVVRGVLRRKAIAGIGPELYLNAGAPVDKLASVDIGVWLRCFLNVRATRDLGQRRRVE